MVKGTATVVSDAQGRREIPSDPIAVHETVERASRWLSRVEAGQSAGEATSLVLSPEEADARLMSGTTVAAGLILLAPRDAIEGFPLLVRRRPLQSALIQDLNFVFHVALNRAGGLALLLRSELP